MVPAPDLYTGRTIGGRYRIESLLGSGGMGVLYVAEHVFTHRRVALKLLHPTRDDDAEQLRARFLSEARTASAVRHPHVVDVLDMGTDEDGLPFLVMELLEGRSLDRVLMGEGRLSPEQTLAWLVPIAGALATLHDAGIVHRDVKPSNIFLCKTPVGRVEPKLLDFGLARAVSDLRLTRSGVVIGTPLYMAPEHASGADVGPQADVWSLGVVLFECLSGQSPYQSRDGAAVATQVLAGQVRPLHLVCPELPQPLVNAVERALRRDLAHRYRDMRALVQGLVAGASASSLRMPEDPDPLGLPEYSSWRAPERVTLPDARADVSASGPRRKQGPSARALPALGLALLCAAAVLWWYLRRSQDTADVPPQAGTVESPAALAPEPPVSRSVPEPKPVVEPLVSPLPVTPPVTPVEAVPERSTEKPASSENDARRLKKRRAPEKEGSGPALDVITEWK